MKKKKLRAAAVLTMACLVAPMIAGGAEGSSVAGAVGATRILTCTGKLLSKPTTYLLSCADANAGWTDMTWSSWTARRATGYGILRQNNCTPNCAGGKFVNYRATVTLSKVVATEKYGELFSRAVFRYSVNGKAKTETFGLAD
jgi:hypothetical protein